MIRPCVKATFTTELAAISYQKERYPHNQSMAYFCVKCTCWHLTRKESTKSRNQRILEKLKEGRGVIVKHASRYVKIYQVILDDEIYLVNFNKRKVEAVIIKKQSKVTQPCKLLRCPHTQYGSKGAAQCKGKLLKEICYTINFCHKCKRWEIIELHKTLYNNLKKQIQSNNRKTFYKAMPADKTWHRVYHTELGIVNVVYHKRKKSIEVIGGLDASKYNN